MRSSLGLCVCIFIYAFLQLAGSEVCFRKYIAHRDACRKMMRKQFKTAQACCARSNAAGYAVEQIVHRKKYFKCLPCSTLTETESVMTTDRTPPLQESVWSEWSDWGTCSTTCEAGVQERVRICSGKKCKGSRKEVQPCSLTPYCPVDGKWGPWFTWQQCTVSCGGGIQVRRRDCNDPPPKHNGKPCEGNSSETRECGVQPCPVDGEWGPWSKFDTCSVTCDSGVQVRKRECDNPMPAYGGRNCHGNRVDKRKCFDRACPINGGWSLWSDWTECSASCGTGKLTRIRKCDSPKPRFGGTECEGPNIEFSTCKVRRPCPVDGSWSSWTHWGRCYAKPCTGEEGYQIRSRSCTSPKPQYGGMYCKGSLVEKRNCYNNVGCKVNGEWCLWSQWTQCSAICGPGSQDRRRFCACPEPANGGFECTGQTYEVRNCTSSCFGDGDRTAGSGDNKEKSKGCFGGSGSGSGDGLMDGSDVGCDQEWDDNDENNEEDSALTKHDLKGWH